ncbi:outer membrane protein assembly factor BamB [Psychrobium sp. 1_MG-2023]|uniref:outer membrane protein assembly factor BamB n=1 Tax=Psychrobium sp. 1_MG-2023 TaxID=3062624 RepID=UPI0026CC6DBD|nr:outer membrane protein assembly factor BamB [Psychrobium sp. 1_MG-2023]MDP2559914.1 outer membrane protein assembly factor BamB [Psychrobium sp. 1_MG-2023]
MTKWSKLLGAGVLASGILSGCSSNDDEIKIAPLPIINSQVELAIDWERSVGDGTGDYFSNLEPAVAYGKVFSADRFGYVSAFDIESGKELWQAELHEGSGLISSGVTAQLSGGIVTGYDKIAIGAESGMLYLLEQETGKLVWKIQTDGEILSKPLLADNKVITVMANGKVVAYDIESGTAVWTYHQDVPALTLRGTSGIIENQGAAFFGLPNGKVSGVLIEDGRAVWESVVTTKEGGNELSSIIDIDSTPMILGATMYAVGYNGNLAAIDVRSGKVNWKRAYSSFQAMTISGFNLYLTTAKGHVFAVDRRSGLELWSQMGLENREITAPAVFDSYIAVVDFEGYLHLLSEETGEFVAQEEIDDSGHIATPIVNDNRLYLQSKDGLLSAISIK